jgi:hypothetical protein|tara:strand:+ start:225 stop:947 length:723 start_codon:yes stop_codon:yes gene_type:complete
MLKISRVENKYFFNQQDLYSIKELLKNIMIVDPNSVDFEPYKISSLYFDTEYDDDLSEKLDGVRYREKYRVRIYNDNEKFGKFEIKRKIENTIFKSSLALNESQIYLACNNSTSFLLDSDDTAYAHARMKFRNYSPKTIITYDRLAFTLPFNNIRVTLDLNMRTHDFTDQNGLKKAIGKGIRIAPKDFEILEVKYTGQLPNFIAESLSHFNLSKTAISKYSAGRLHSSLDLFGDNPHYAS